ncbi:MAG: hypothetical protein NT047_07550 [Deltaproteobacteria bacterium]|nr:hypothetical protein [Deltaproteobacteria bacterium]
MKGYPKVIATKADFDFLLADPEFKDRALADLKTVADLADDTMERVVSYDLDVAGKMINIVTETVPAPLPTWKRLGFASGENTADLYAVNAPVVIETTKGGN